MELFRQLDNRRTNKLTDLQSYSLSRYRDWKGDSNDGKPDTLQQAHDALKSQREERFIYNALKFLIYNALKTFEIMFKSFVFIFLWNILFIML